MKGVISIGSHWGEEYKKWIAEGFENFVFFEPVSFNFHKLQRKVPESEGVKLFNIALGNIQGTIKMNIEKSNHGRSCSVLQPENHLITNPKIKFKKDEFVHIDKLDNVEYDRNLFDFLHLYAQGYELEILKGAIKSLSFIKFIEIEVFKKEQYKGCALFDDIVVFLKEQGFEFIKVDWYNAWGKAEFRRV